MKIGAQISTAKEPYGSGTVRHELKTSFGQVLPGVGDSVKKNQAFPLYRASTGT